MMSFFLWLMTLLYSAVGIETLYFLRVFFLPLLFAGTRLLSNHLQMVNGWSRPLHKFGPRWHQGRISQLGTERPAQCQGGEVGHAWTAHCLLFQHQNLQCVHLGECKVWVSIWKQFETFFKLEQNITRLWWLPPTQYYDSICCNFDFELGSNTKKKEEAKRSKKKEEERRREHPRSHRKKISNDHVAP